MGSLRWAQGSGLPSASVTSLWRWATSQLGLDRTTRYFQVDEEKLGLTDRDELNRTYMEDSPFPLINTSTERRPAGSNDCRAARTSTHNTATRDITHITPSPKETRTTVTFTAPRNTTRTSVLSNSSTNGEDKPWTTNKHTCKTRTFQIYSEEKPSFNQHHTNKRRPYRLATLSGTGTLNQDHIDLNHTHVESIKPALEDRSHAEPPCSLKVGDNGEESSYICAQLEEDGSKMGLVRSTTTGTVGLKPARTITTWEAAWNVTNAIQGIFVLGLPYALVRSGYLGLILLVLSAWVCNHTGRVLVDCLYEQQHSSGLVRVRHSYQDIAEACCRGLGPRWVGLGDWMVNVSQVLELLITCTLYLVVSTSLVCESLSWTAVPRSVFSLGSLVALLPCLMLTDLRPVSTLSLLCSVAHGLISLLVMLYCLSRASSWSWARLSLSGDPEDVLVSVGVIIFSYTSQIYLPHLEGSMEHKGEFRLMLGWSHAVACVIKTLFSLVAVLTWGAETREVITDNLPSDLRPLVNLCLLAKALLSYPLPFYSAAEILQTCLLRGTVAASPSSGVRGWDGAYPGLLVRSALLMTSYLLALLVPRFSLLMGLTGSVTGAAMALILPCVCHLQLHWKRLSMMDRLTDVAILSLGLTCSLSGVICCAKRLMENV